MAIGLRRAPKTFQELMSQEVLIGYVDLFCKVYQDDFMIYFKNYDEHIRHLALVLERLKMYHPTRAVEKCRSGKMSLEFLGFLVSAWRKEVNEEYVNSLLEIPPPTSKRYL